MIDANQGMIGIMPLKEALKRAQRDGLDLIEISPSAAPPVCKIADFGKYKYEQEKRQHEARKKQKTVDIKEIKVRPNIAIGDFNIKLKNAERFLKEGHKVKFIMQFRGREIAHTDVGFSVVERFKEALIATAKLEQAPKLEGKNIVMLLLPKL